MYPHTAPFAISLQYSPMYIVYPVLCQREPAIMQEHSIVKGTDFQSLLGLGFSEIEAAKLAHMKEHVNEQVEYREILQESRRLDFMRWLIAHDRLKD